jgi:hypothetical protein
MATHGSQCWECQCANCDDKECPVPCRAQFDCDAPTTNCKDQKPLRQEA